MVAVVVMGKERLTTWRTLSSRRRIALASLGGVVLLPLVHVAVETARVGRRDKLVYDAELDGGAGALRGMRALIGRMDDSLPTDSLVVMTAAVVVVGAAFIVRRRASWLAVAALLSGTLALLFAGMAGVVVSRYYLPTFALFAVALPLGLACFGPRVRIAGAVLMAAVGLVSIPSSHDEVEHWALQEQEWGEFVRAVTEADASGCPVAAARVRCRGLGGAPGAGRARARRKDPRLRRWRDVSGDWA